MIIYLFSTDYKSFWPGIEISPVTTHGVLSAVVRFGRVSLLYVIDQHVITIINDYLSSYL